MQTIYLITTGGTIEKEYSEQMGVVLNHTRKIGDYLKRLRLSGSEVRVVPLDGRQHVSPKIRTYMGDARGHFEGNTLVVETTNFTERSAYRGASADLKMTERFKPLSPTAVDWMLARVRERRRNVRRGTIGLDAKRASITMNKTRRAAPMASVVTVRAEVQA